VLERSGLAPLVAAAALAVTFSACHGREEAGVKSGPAAPPAAAAPRSPTPHALPFTHPMLSQAAPHVAHEDCSKEALWVVAYRLRDVHKKAERARAEAAKKHGRSKTPAPAPGGPGGAATQSCGSPEVDELGRQVRSETLYRVGACVGRDNPLDPEWDMVNSGVLSLGVCLDCSRTPEARAKDCQRALDVIDRADKLSRGQGPGEIPLRANGAR
jgi:hypothetical protein